MSYQKIAYSVLYFFLKSCRPSHYSLAGRLALAGCLALAADVVSLSSGSGKALFRPAMGLCLLTGGDEDSFAYHRCKI